MAESTTKLNRSRPPSRFRPVPSHLAGTSTKIASAADHIVAQQNKEKKARFSCLVQKEKAGPGAERCPAGRRV
ncbi:hypothetical protein SLA2020_350950 [Shorea laevis]